MSQVVKKFRIKGIQAPKVEHATFGGSSSYVWLNCTGWYDLVQAVPHKESSGMKRAADEGSACHLVMEELVIAHTPPEKRFSSPALLPKAVSDPRLQPEHFLGCTVSFERRPDTDAVILTADHIKYIRECFETVEPYLTLAVAVFVERKVYASPDFGEHAFGYVDLAVLYKLHNGRYRLIVVDYKFGWVRVNVLSEQLQYYAAGITKEVLHLMEMRNDLPDKPAIELECVECIILQPKLSPHGWSSCTYTVDELLAFVVRAERAIFTAMGGQGKLTAGAYCKYCSAAKICPELQRQLVDFPPEHLTEGIHDFKGEEWAALVKKAHLARIAASRVEAAAFDYIVQGGVIPGYKVVQTKDSLSWRSKAEAEAALIAKGVPEAALYKRAIRTPKELARQMADLDFTDLTERVIQNALAPMEDRRQAVSPEASVAFPEWEGVSETE